MITKKLKINKSYVLFIGLIIISACNQKKYKCATELPKTQIDSFKTHIVTNTLKEELIILQDAITLVNEKNSPDSVRQVTLVQKAKNLLVLDIYGIADRNKIDDIACRLFSHKTFKLPTEVILLFHSYSSKLDDGGIVVGLTNKKLD